MATTFYLTFRLSTLCSALHNDKTRNQYLITHFRGLRSWTVSSQILIWINNHGNQVWLTFSTFCSAPSYINHVKMHHIQSLILEALIVAVCDKVISLQCWTNRERIVETVLRWFHLNLGEDDDDAAALGCCYRVHTLSQVRVGVGTWKCGGTQCREITITACWRGKKTLKGTSRQFVWLQLGFITKINHVYKFGGFTLSVRRNITSSEQRSLKFTPSKLIIFGHR